MKESNEFDEFEPLDGLDEEFEDHYFDGDDLDEDALYEIFELEEESFDDF